MERFAKVDSSFQLLSILAKHSILDVWQAFEYAFATCNFSILIATELINVNNIWFSYCHCFP